MASTYLSGSLVRTTVTFANSAGTAADPSTVTLKYRPGPLGTAVTTVVYPSSPIVKDSTGVYHADLDTTGWLGSGTATWTIEWIGTGTVQAIGTDTWTINPEPL
jgi:hypothetical protein